MASLSYLINANLLQVNANLLQGKKLLTWLRGQAYFQRHPPIFTISAAKNNICLWDSDVFESICK